MWSEEKLREAGLEAEHEEKGPATKADEQSVAQPSVAVSLGGERSGDTLPPAAPAARPAPVRPPPPRREVSWKVTILWAVLLGVGVFFLLRMVRGG